MSDNADKHTPNANAAPVPEVRWDEPHLGASEVAAWIGLTTSSDVKPPVVSAGSRAKFVTDKYATWKERKEGPPPEPNAPKGKMFPWLEKGLKYEPKALEVLKEVAGLEDKDVQVNVPLMEHPKKRFIACVVDCLLGDMAVGEFKIPWIVLENGIFPKDEWLMQCYTMLEITDRPFALLVALDVDANEVHMWRVLRDREQWHQPHVLSTSFANNPSTGEQEERVICDARKTLWKVAMPELCKYERACEIAYNTLFAAPGKQVRGFLDSWSDPSNMATYGGMHHTVRTRMRKEFAAWRSNAVQHIVAPKRTLDRILWSTCPKNIFALRQNPDYGLPLVDKISLDKKDPNPAKRFARVWYESALDTNKCNFRVYDDPLDDGSILRSGGIVRAEWLPFVGTKREHLALGAKAWGLFKPPPKPPPPAKRARGDSDEEAFSD